MENSTKFVDALWSLLLQLPSLLTMLACILAAVFRWKRHPRVSLTVVVALSLMLIHAFVFAFVFAYVPDLFARPGDYGMMRAVITIISFIYSSSLAIAFGILFLSVFMKRSMPASPTETRGSLA
jgi:uncharacterized BrkB/YihY/UPF0761 family membrane protein